MMIYDEMSHLLLMYVTYPPIHICFKLMALKTSNKTIEFIFKSIFLYSLMSFFFDYEWTFRLDCRGERYASCQFTIIPSILLIVDNWSIVFSFFHEHDATDYFHSLAM